MNENLLISLVTVLVEEYGLTRVQAALAKVELGSVGSLQPALAEHKEKGSKRKLSPVEIAERTKAPVERRRLLGQLADQFERKTFLPASSDVREFLEMRGYEWRSGTPRNDGFRKVLDILLELTDEELKALLEGASHTALVRLGPLSDAMDEAGVALRGKDDEDLPSAPGRN